jgi:hypothetical protein
LQSWQTHVSKNGSEKDRQHTAVPKALQPSNETKDTLSYDKGHIAL